MLKYIYTTVIAISLLIAFLNVGKQQANELYKKHFLLFLGCTFIIEIIGLILIKMGKHNLWIYNIYSVLEFLAYSYFYLLHLSHFKKVIRIFIVVFPLLFVINIFFFQPLFTQFNSYTYLLGSMYLVILSITFLYEQFSMEENLEKNLLLNFMFWVSVGILFFYGGSMMLDSAINYLIKHDKHLADRLYDIILVLNMLMYSLFAIGFACPRIFRKSLSL